MRILVALALATAIARADTKPTPVDASGQLRDANAAATAGEWLHVARIVEPLLSLQLAPADLAESHRLYGLALYFQGFKDLAEPELLRYLLADPDGNLDPTLYPTEVVSFFEGIKSDHKAEIDRARRAKTPQRGYGWLSWLPIASQIQNREYTKAIVIGGAIGGLIATQAITFFVLNERWCKDNPQCDSNGGSTNAAKIVRDVNFGALAAWVALGVYAWVDGRVIYVRQHKRESIHAFALPVSRGGLVGISASW